MLWVISEVRSLIFVEVYILTHTFSAGNMHHYLVDTVLTSIQFLVEIFNYANDSILNIKRLSRKINNQPRVAKYFDQSTDKKVK